MAGVGAALGNITHRHRAPDRNALTIALPDHELGMGDGSGRVQPLDNILAGCTLGCNVSLLSATDGEVAPDGRTAL